MGNVLVAVTDAGLEQKIFDIRRQQVMLDRDLAELYGVETKVLNQAVKRNIERFPASFRFQLTDAEKNELVTNCDRFASLKHTTVLPYAFTEQGVAMLSAVLRSKAAVQVSIQIMQAFVEMRRLIANHAPLLQRLDALEKRQLSSEIRTEARFEQIFNVLEDKHQAPAQGVFFEGQIFDAYTFINDVIRQAKKSIILIDNYVDDSVLIQLNKRNKGVSAHIFTRIISKALAQDIKKYNLQYPEIVLHELADSHDRFLILDSTDVYHLGASLKDLGKKWFAFSKMDASGLKVIERIKGLS